MITEDYVSFEVSKLLKSKKFHVPTRSHYDSRGGFGFLDICEIDWNNYKCFRERRCYSAPTLQMAMKWLREIYHIHIRLINSSDESYRYEIYPREGEYRSSCFSDRCYYETYEKAADSAIKYCLKNNLIF